MPDKPDVKHSALKEHKIKVLLIDDQRIVAEDIRRMLSEYSDIHYEYCPDPNNALQKAIEIQPTVILQDLIMPDIDGMTLVKYYQGHPKTKNIPVIVLSSREEGVTKAEAFEKGAHDYMVKPADKTELVARIRYHSKAYITFLERNQAMKALRTELDKAANYVRSLLPVEMTEGDIQSKWTFKPSIELGGDIFGCHYIDDTHFAMYLLDVSGHGVGSALLSVSAQNILRQKSFGDIDFRKPVDVAHLVNKSFQMSDHNGLYFTLWYGVFNTETRELEYLSAGHPPSVLVDSENQIHYLSTDNIIIGAIDDFPFQSGTIKIDPSSVLYIYSDGAYEVSDENDVMWTVEEMAAYLKHNRSDDDSEIFDLHGVLIERCGEVVLDDDYSILKLKFK